ncbi:MAG: AMP-binding protein [Acidobacteria bacterium]|nr:AMP-binding protein [Acidobacteriota bacterium]
MSDQTTVAPEPDADAERRAVSGEALLAVVRQVVEELHPSAAGKRMTLDSSLDRDLALDSLGRVEVVGRLEKAFGVGLADGVVASAETPRDLLRAVVSAVGPAAGVAESVAHETAELGAAEPAPERSRTLVEVLDWHVDHNAERRHVTLLASDGETEELTYGALRQSALAVAAGLQERGLEPSQMVGLMLPTSLDYFAAFFGVLLAGGVPVPLYPPARLSQIEDHLKRQAGILATARARFMITVPEVLPLARLLRAQVPTLRRTVTVAELSMPGANPSLPVVRENDIAFLQFTSGSTADPKGVVLTHANLLANLRAFGQMAEMSAADVAVSWLPLYHDMGLIGAWMGSLYYAMPLVLMSPLAFLTRPARWLWAIHHHRATLSAGPNFAYELCLSKIEDAEIEGLDLSSLRGSLNGAEPVSPATIRRFTERFAEYGYRPEMMMPVYGLAECSVGLAFPPVGRGPVVDVVRREPLSKKGRAEAAAVDDDDAVRFVGAGFALPGHEIRIVDGTGAEVGERQEGRIEFRGPSATSGYFRNPEATAKLFHGDWLDSGDLGYLAKGELFVTGRAKDMIIRAGQNIYPQELEEAVGDLDGVRKGCVAVFGTTEEATGTERLIVLAETRATEDEALQQLRDRIQELSVDLVGTPADDVKLVPPHTVPKTSSGKIRRAAGRALYEGGRLRRRGPVWWQVARLAMAGARPQWVRTRRAARELAYAGRFWTVVGLAAVPVVAGIVLLPRLARRRRMAREAARGIARLTSTPIRVSGEEHLAGAGPFVVTANHASYLDGFALAAALPPDGAFLAKSELRGSFVARLLLERLGTLFVERFDPSKSVEDIEQAAEALAGGQSLLVFPEGTFDRAPGLRPFRLGAFLLAAQSGTPVVPVAIRGTRSVLRGDQWFPRRGSLTVTIGAPIAPDGTDLAAAARLRDAVRAEILEHCGEPDRGAE